MASACDRLKTKCGVATAFLVACLAGCDAKPLDLAKGDVEGVEIQLEKWGEKQKAAKVSKKDAATFEALLAVLRSGEATKDHKCGASGEITFRRKDGGEIKIGILAGHDPRYYEYRAHRSGSYDIFRVERVSFLKAIKAFGINAELDPGSPE